MPKQRYGLGRGLDALIPGGASLPTISEETPLDTSLANSAIFAVPVNAIIPNTHQPRMPMSDDTQLLELASSIQEYGLLQPVLVRIDGLNERGEPRYQLIAGERRWRAAQLAGLATIPAVIREATPQLMLEMALVENLQRTDLNPLEAAQGYLTLIEEYGLTQEEVAARVGRDRASVANTIRLLQLPEEVREKLVTLPNVFTEGHARAVLQINGDAERIMATQKIIAEGMSVRAAEDLARRYNEASLRLTPDRHGARVRVQSYETRQLEEEFTQACEMKVRLQRATKGHGSITFYFTNEDQLNVLHERLVRMVNARIVSGDGNGVPLLAGGNGLDTVDELLDDTFDITFDSADDPDSHGDN